MLLKNTAAKKMSNQPMKEEEVKEPMSTPKIVGLTSGLFFVLIILFCFSILYMSAWDTTEDRVAEMTPIPRLENLGPPAVMWELKNTFEDSFGFTFQDVTKDSDVNYSSDVVSIIGSAPNELSAIQILQKDGEFSTIVMYMEMSQFDDPDSDEFMLPIGYLAMAMKEMDNPDAMFNWFGEVMRDEELQIQLVLGQPVEKIIAGDEISMQWTTKNDVEMLVITMRKH